MYEGPAAVQLEDGSWNLFLDYYGKTEKASDIWHFTGKAWQPDL